jgi:hypothetical protein
MLGLVLGRLNRAKFNYVKLDYPSLANHNLLFSLRQKDRKTERQKDRKTERQTDKIQTLPNIT